MVFAVFSGFFSKFFPVLDGLDYFDGMVLGFWWGFEDTEVLILVINYDRGSTN